MDSIQKIGGKIAADFLPSALADFIRASLVFRHGSVLRRVAVPGGPLLLGDEDIPGLGALEGAYNALFLHLVHDSGSSGIAQL